MLLGQQRAVSGVCTWWEFTSPRPSFASMLKVRLPGTLSGQGSGFKRNESEQTVLVLQEKGALYRAVLSCVAPALSRSIQGPSSLSWHQTLRVCSRAQSNLALPTR